MEDFAGVWKSIFTALKGHPEAVFGATCLLVGAALLSSGVNGVLAGGFPLCVYVIYNTRMKSKEAHDRRMAELNVESVEAQEGRETLKRMQRRIAGKVASDAD
ncbi:hypothetical protein GR183_12125 [Stappia sp. GBMRC 2046]|uniref:Uncharacterized protein n=1 Tax=Stappia sediminis TaxID=2692190 RepID=A0A7X3LV34_9HYPH|nr:hypothetical protein [Stappia sediminis]MXN65652.1 hypothetical protein [Stappia sediminis]